MTKHHRFFLPVLLLVLACAESGTPPEISALRVTPEEVASGTLTPVVAALEFRDVEGDVLEALVSLRANGVRTEPMTVGVTGANGITAGAVSLQLSLSPPVPGEYGVTVWLRDEHGNDSNPLEAIVVAR